MSKSYEQKWADKEFGSGTRLEKFHSFIAHEDTEIIYDSCDHSFTPAPYVEFLHQWDGVTFDFLYKNRHVVIKHKISGGPISAQKQGEALRSIVANTFMKVYRNNPERIEEIFALNRL